MRPTTDYKALYDRVEHLLERGEEHQVLNLLQGAADDIAIDFPDRHGELEVLLDEAEGQYLAYLKGEREEKDFPTRRLLLLLQDLGWRYERPVSHDPLQLVLGGGEFGPTILREGNLPRVEKKETPGISSRTFVVVALVLLGLAIFQFLKTLRQYGYLSEQRTEPRVELSLG